MTVLYSKSPPTGLLGAFASFPSGGPPAIVPAARPDNRRGATESAVNGEQKSEPSKSSSDPAPSPTSAHESARFLASISLSLGALMLSLFGIIERMVSFEQLAVGDEHAVLAALPGIAMSALW